MLIFLQTVPKDAKIVENVEVSGKRLTPLYSCPPISDGYILEQEKTPQCCIGIKQLHLYCCMAREMRLFNNDF